MEKDSLVLLQQTYIKLGKSFLLVEASLEDLAAYEPSRNYTPKELEPYDALADRFIRCVEIFIRYFKTYEYYNYAIASDTFRDGLNKMAKLDLITDVVLWMRMRDIRNKIVHDYLPEHVQAVFDNIMSDFFVELKRTKLKIDQIHMRIQ